MGKARKIFVSQVVKPLARSLVFLVLVAGMGYRWMFYAPGTSFSGEVQVSENALSRELERYIKDLAVGIGERGIYNLEAYRKSSTYIQERFKDFGYTPRIQTYRVGKVDCDNIEVMITGTTNPQSILVVGAHYDTVQGTGGANDNTSGTAAVLTLSRMLRESKPGKTIRFVAFANEEPPQFQTPQMGSFVYAKACKDRSEKVVGMLSLETIGYYTDEPNSQRYPAPFDKIYPTTGNFIGFVADTDSRLMLHKTIGLFRKHCQFPSEGAAIPDRAPGVGWSDHWAFWQNGFEAVMVTDTATFRYPHYHRRSDTPEQLDFGRMAKVVEGLKSVIQGLAE